MDARHDGAGGVRLLVSPSRDEKHAYTPDQARAIAALIVEAATEAEAWFAGIAHQGAVVVPNPHAAQTPSAEPDTPVVIETPAEPKRSGHTDAQKAAANKRRREQRAARKGRK